MACGDLSSDAIGPCERFSRLLWCFARLGPGTKEMSASSSRPHQWPASTFRPGRLALCGRCFASPQGSLAWPRPGSRPRITRWPSSAFLGAEQAEKFSRNSEKFPQAPLYRQRPFRTPAMDGPSRRSGRADGWTSIFPGLPGHHGVQDCDHWRLPSAQLSVTPGAPSLGEGPPDFTPPVMARRMLPHWIGFGDELPPSLLIHHGPGGSLCRLGLGMGSPEHEAQGRTGRFQPPRSGCCSPV